MKKCITTTCMLIDDGKVLFLKHIKFGNWMPPGGHVDEGENPIDALHREFSRRSRLWHQHYRYLQRSG